MIKLCDAAKNKKYDWNTSYIEKLYKPGIYGSGKSLYDTDYATKKIIEYFKEADIKIIEPNKKTTIEKTKEPEKTLDELMKEGYSLRDANKIIKGYEEK